MSASRAGSCEVTGVGYKPFYDPKNLKPRTVSSGALDLQLEFIPVASQLHQPPQKDSILPRPEEVRRAVMQP